MELLLSRVSAVVDILLPQKNGLDSTKVPSIAYLLQFILTWFANVQPLELFIDKFHQKDGAA